MVEKELLKQLGFSNEFIDKIDDYNKNMNTFRQSDFANKEISQSTSDSNNIIIRAIDNPAKTDCVISRHK